jgi:hypothetical protein
MAYPEFKNILEIGFTNNRSGYWQLGVSTLGETTVLGGSGISASVDFVQVEGRLTGGLSISRGRPSELEQCEAGTMSFTLENEDGYFTPTNVNSPWFGNIKPLRQVRYSILADGVTYPMYHGFVEDWQASFQGNVAVVNITTADLFTWLAKRKLSMSFDTQTTGARIGKVLDAVEWDTSYRDIDDGWDTVTGSTISDVSALDEIHALANCERGLFFIDRRGYARYQDRRYRNVSSNASVLSLNNNDWVYLTQDTFSANNIYNQVMEDGIEIFIDKDTQSIADYGIIPYDLPTPYVPTAQKTLLAEYIVAQYRQWNPRYIMGLEIKSHYDRARFLSLEISDMFVITSKQWGIDNGKYLIESITHDIDMSGGGIHRITLGLSPADITAYWILGYSTLGETTRLAY